jgi:hypothetical protein
VPLQVFDEKFPKIEFSRNDKVLLYDKQKIPSIYDVELQKFTSFPAFCPTRYYSYYPLKQKKNLVLLAGWVNGNDLKLLDTNDGSVKAILDNDAVWSYYEEK